MEMLRRNHFELKVKSIDPLNKEDSPVYLYISKYFDLSDHSHLELSYFTENLSLSIVLPHMPTNDLDKKFSSDFIIKHRVQSYLPSEVKDLDYIYQDFYGIEKRGVLMANELALETIRGAPLETNPLTKRIISSPIAWVVFCHAMKKKDVTSKFMKLVLKHDNKIIFNPVFDILPFVYEDVDMAY